MNNLLAKDATFKKSMSHMLTCFAKGTYPSVTEGMPDVSHSAM